MEKSYKIFNKITSEKNGNHLSREAAEQFLIYVSTHDFMSCLPGNMSCKYALKDFDIVEEILNDEEFEIIDLGEVDEKELMPFDDDDISNGTALVKTGRKIHHYKVVRGGEILTTTTSLEVAETFIRNYEEE